MIIRKWLFEDNLQVSKLEKQTFDDFWSQQIIADTFLLDNFIGFVAEENGKIIGYLSTTYCLDEGEIDRIAVSNNYKRKGIATSLLNALFLECKKKNINKIFLEVRRSNEVAQALYEKNGFTYVGVRPLYYKGEEDALIMSKLVKE